MQIVNLVQKPFGQALAVQPPLPVEFARPKVQPQKQAQVQAQVQGQGQARV